MTEIKKCQEDDVLRFVIEVYSNLVTYINALGAQRNNNDNRIRTLMGQARNVRDANNVIVPIPIVPRNLSIAPYPNAMQNADPSALHLEHSIRQIVDLTDVVQEQHQEIIRLRTFLISWGVNPIA